MAYIINFKSYSDERGGLLPIEDRDLPFKIKRVFSIYGTKENLVRGKHRHKKATQAIICFNGSCLVYNNNGKKEETFILDNPNKCLILEPGDWHCVSNFKGECVIQILSSEYYNSDDYVSEPY